jgi:16S rRNA (guanine527-N7)-methyltransferase
LSLLLKENEKILDVGTGGGVPGVILAILRPDLCVELCESVAKKARAVDAIVQSLHLNVSVHHGRVELVLQQAAYDTLVARAVGPMWKVLKWIEPHWSAVGRLLLVKGPRWIEERREARTKGLLKLLELRRLATYRLAETNSEGVVLGIRPAGADR